MEILPLSGKIFRFSIGKNFRGHFPDGAQVLEILKFLGLDFGISWFWPKILGNFRQKSEIPKVIKNLMFSDF